MCKGIRRDHPRGGRRGAAQRSAEPTPMPQEAIDDPSRMLYKWNIKQVASKMFVLKIC